MFKAVRKNFVDMIHNEAYLEPFMGEDMQIRSESLINDYGRKIELLNGRWRFTIDPYDTCLRGKWWNNNNRDDAGAYVPVLNRKRMVEGRCCRHRRWHQCSR